MRKLAVIIIFALSVLMMNSSASAFPVVEIPAKTDGDTIAVFFSGDGGWLKIDQVIAERLASEGIHVIGINSMNYFRKKRTPDETASDVISLIDSYSGKLNRNRVILIGYSFGADVVPFIVNRFSPSLRPVLAGAVMLNIAEDSTFEVCKYDSAGYAKGGFKTLPEISRIDGTPLLFIGGIEDKDTITGSMDKNKYSVVVTEGGHHFGGDYKYLADIILDWYNQ